MISNMFSKSFKSLFFLLLFVGFSSAFAKPYPGPQGAADIINDRQANQDKRIAAGKAAGQISPQEEAQLNQMVEFINNAETQANKANKNKRIKGSVKVKGSGNIDAAEFHEIMGMLDLLSDRIKISSEAEAVAVRMPNAPTQPVSAPTGSNVAQGKQPYPGPQRAAEIINERQANQDKRIAAGKAAGQISPQEEAQLNQMVEFINNAETQANTSNKSARQRGGTRAPGSGNINAAEFDKIMGMLDQLSDKIRISREAEDVAVRMPNAPIQPVSAPTGSNVAQGKQPYPGPQGAADIINERQANQDKRIAAGKAAGQISPQEEAQLNQMVEFINNVEAQANKANKSARKTGFIKAKGSGNINEKEFHEIMGMLDQLSDKIRISREAEAVAVRMPNAPIQPVVR